MSHKFNRIIVLSFALLFLLMVIPTCIAVDNETVIMAESANDTAEVLESQNTGDVLGKDYYFDSNAEDDTGDGSIDNPYKELSGSRIKDNSVIHLANGNYSLKDIKSYKDISVYGQDASKTIITSDNDELSVSGNFDLKNVTLINTQILSQGVMTASNTVFMDSNPLRSDRFGNDFGGAIYSPSGKGSIALDNCTFIGNHAEYGGAICIKGGSLEIDGCLFINNTAYNYGGAIAASVLDSKKPKVKIRNTVFINSTSLNDAGGAIYLKSSSINCENVTIDSSRATFGSALTLLNTYTHLSNMHLVNNTAEYDGGAIYLMYGNLTLVNSSFIDNRANNGGALYIDGCYYFFIVDNTFKRNCAKLSAGAVYSVLNDYGINENNTYENNSATLYSDLYATLELDPVIYGGNYTLYQYNLTSGGSLPKYYNSCDLGYVGPVMDQGDSGNCWAFAILSTLESCISRITGLPIDLSEENMKNLIERYSDYGWSMATNEGGYYEMGIGYLVAWLGPVLESDDLYDDNSDLSPLLESIMHVQNIAFVNRNSFTDNNAIKRAIMDYGAVYSGIYIDESYSSKLKKYYQYVNDIDECDHAVSIVGWDDAIAIPGAPGPGAWIAKNSWGADWGNKGYYYVSYYDTSCARINSEFSTFTFILNDTIRYDKNYQYDLPGMTDYFLNSSSTVWYKNKYVATDNEYLAAVSTYFEKNTNWDLSIYVNDVLKLTKSGYSASGYHTIEFSEFIPLELNDSFEIVFKINVKGRAGVPISEIISINQYFYKEGVSFLSYDGKNWKDLYELEWNYPDHTYSSQVACIKAFTLLDLINTTLDLSVSYDGFNPVEITANVYNDRGGAMNVGRVIFNLSNEIYTVNVSNGIAKITHIFKRGSNTISAVFDACGYVPSAKSTQIDVTKYDVDIELSVSSSYDTSTVNVTLSKPISEAVTISLNDHVYHIDSRDGFLSHTFTYLDYGFYDVKAIVDTALYDSNLETANFTINVKKTNIRGDSFTTVYKSGQNYVIQLFDSFGQSLKNKSITITLNGKDYVRTTNETGEVSIPISLAVGSYELNANFKGDEDYSKSGKTSKITVKSSITFSNTVFTYNSKCKISFVDKQSKPLANRQVTFSFDGVNYKLKTNSLGAVYLTITKKPGIYALKVTNPETGEAKFQTIKVLARITQNKNINMYYGAGTAYKVKVLDDNGKAAAGVKVKFTLNGKYYYRTTDKNGFASMKITLNPKTYNIIAYYKGFKVTNKIVVKPTIITKNIASKKTSVKFTAKLVNAKGTILKNKAIKFKVGSKTYSAKTNANGIASLILNNLKVGKYTVTSTYGTAKVTNYIKITK